MLIFYAAQPKLNSTCSDSPVGVTEERLDLQSDQTKEGRNGIKSAASTEPAPVTHPKIGGCESGRSGDVGGGGRVGVEGIDVGQQSAHHRWHP